MARRYDSQTNTFSPEGVYFSLVVVVALK